MSEPHSARGPTRPLAAEEIGQRLLKLLENWRVASLSLHNAEGDLIWLNQGVFGPDEHRQVLDALDLFALESQRQWLERKIEGAGRALFFCARNNIGERCGVVMAIVQSRSRQKVDAPFIWTPGLESLMQRFSATLANASTPPKPATESHTETEAPRTTLANASTPPKPATESHTETEAPRTTHASDAAPHRARRYARLRSGGNTRRYELARPSSSSADEDTQAVTRLTEYLAHQREHYERQPVSFTVPICGASLLEPHFIASVEVCLQVADIPAAQVGFCIPAEIWQTQTSLVEGFAQECARIGCFLALDDFVLSDAGLALLRCAAVRCLKLQTQLTAEVMRDKYSQAMVAAIVQAARVLGLYCVAKNVESASLAKWLSGAGIEFVDNPNRSVSDSQTLAQVSQA